MPPIENNNEEHVECANCQEPFDDDLRVYHVDDDGNPYCESCYDELFSGDDEEFGDDIFNQPSRNNDPQLKKEIDDSKDVPDNFDALPLIKSKRTFGVELEMFGGDVQAMSAYCAEHGHTYTRDGSIVGNNACEIASKVFTGQEGARQFLDMCAYAQKAGFKTNFSCGTHVHFGAKDFFSNEMFKPTTMAKMPNSRDNTVVLIELPLLTQMRKCMNDDTIANEFIQEAGLNFKQGQGWFTNYRMYDGRTSNICAVNAVYAGRTYLIVLRVSTLERLKCKPYDVLQGNVVLEIGEEFTELRRTDHYKSVATIAIDRIVPFTKPANRVWERLKSLFATYSYFDELLFCMLPARRRNSEYCKPLRETYALTDVLNCDSQDHIERTWYKASTTKEVMRAKLEHGNLHSRYNSRYHSVNIHSLFHRYGTLEIRMHHGTINGHSVLAWTALHQRIMDRIADGSLNWETIAGLDRRASRQKKAYMFKKLFALDKEPELLRFVAHRLKHYSNIILK